MCTYTMTTVPRMSASQKFDAHRAAPRCHLRTYTENFLDLVIVAKATIATTRVGLDLIT